MEKTSNILTTIRFFQPTMTASEQEIADYVLKNFNEIPGQSLARLSEECGCGQATIIRFCRRIGCRNFLEFKEKLRDFKPSDPQISSYSIRKESSVSDMIKGIQHLYLDTMKRVDDLNPPHKYEEASQHIVRSNRIFLFAIGDALVPCLYAHYRFSRIGLSCLFSEDADMQLIHASEVNARDVVIAVSHSGETRHIVRAVEAAHRAGAYVLGITQTSRSSMTPYCDLLFYNATSDLSIGKTLVAHRLAESYIFEILYGVTVQQMPETSHETLKYSAELLTANKLE